MKEGLVHPQYDLSCPQIFGSRHRNVRKNIWKEERGSIPRPQRMLIIILGHWAVTHKTLLLQSTQMVVMSESE